MHTRLDMAIAAVLQGIKSSDPDDTMQHVYATHGCKYSPRLCAAVLESLRSIKGDECGIDELVEVIKGVLVDKYNYDETYLNGRPDKMRHKVGRRSKPGTVWEVACDWAPRNYRFFRSASYSHDQLCRHLSRLVREWSGVKAKRWLFVYSPESNHAVFEVANQGGRMAMAHSKLMHVAERGGMLFGVDANAGQAVPLVVVKPKSNE